MIKLNSKLKSILTLLFVILISIVSFNSIIYLSKKITTEKEVYYHYYTKLNVTDFNFIDEKLHFKFIDKFKKEYTLISDVKCNFDLDKFNKFKKETIRVEISVIKFKNIFTSKIIDKIRFEEDYNNYFCK